MYNMYRMYYKSAWLACNDYAHVHANNAFP